MLNSRNLIIILIIRGKKGQMELESEMLGRVTRLKLANNYQRNKLDYYTNKPSKSIVFCFF